MEWTRSCSHISGTLYAGLDSDEFGAAAPEARLVSCYLFFRTNWSLTYLTILRCFTYNIKFSPFQCILAGLHTCTMQSLGLVSKFYDKDLIQKTCECLLVRSELRNCNISCRSRRMRAIKLNRWDSVEWFTISPTDKELWILSLYIDLGVLTLDFAKSSSYLW